MGRNGHVRAIAERTAEGGAALVERTAEGGAALAERAGLAVAEGGLALADAAVGEIADLASDILGAAGSASRRLPWRLVIGIAIGAGAIGALIALLARRRRSASRPFSQNGGGHYSGLDETLDESFPSSDAPATQMSPRA